MGRKEGMLGGHKELLGHLSDRRTLQLRSSSMAQKPSMVAWLAGEGQGVNWIFCAAIQEQNGG